MVVSDLPSPPVRSLCCSSTLLFLSPCCFVNRRFTRFSTLYNTFRCLVVWCIARDGFLGLGDG